MIIQFALGMVAHGARRRGSPGRSFFAFFLSIGASGFLPPYLTTVALIAPPRIRSQAYAYSLLFFALGGVVLSRIAADVGDHHGLRLGRRCCSRCSSPSAGSSALTRRRFIRRDVEEAAKSIKAQEAAEHGTFLVVQRRRRRLRPGAGALRRRLRGRRRARSSRCSGRTAPASRRSSRRSPDSSIPIGGAIFFEGRDITHADAEREGRDGHRAGARRTRRSSRR